MRACACPWLRSARARTFSQVLIKPSEYASLTAACILRLVRQAGLPEDRLIVVCGDGALRCDSARAGDARNAPALPPSVLPPDFPSLTSLSLASPRLALSPSFPLLPSPVSSTHSAVCGVSLPSAQRRRERQSARSTSTLSCSSARRRRVLKCGPHTRTRTNAHTHARTHAHTHACTHGHTHAHGGGSVRTRVCGGQACLRA